MGTTQVRAKKGNGLDELIQGLSVKTLEESKSVTRTGRSTFDVLLEKYDLLVQKGVNDQGVNTKERVIYLQQEVVEILSPQEITSLASVLYIHAEDYRPNFWYSEMEAQNISMLLTRLIQNSYDAGNNHFLIDTTNMFSIYNTPSMNRLFELGYGLTGRKENPIHLNINGNPGTHFLTKAHYVKAAVQGSVDDFCGYKSKHLAVTISHDAKSLCGGHSYASSFVIKGKVDCQLARNAKFSSFSMAKVHDWGLFSGRPYFCTFSSSCEQTVKELLQHVPLGNKVVFIPSEGQAEIRRIDHLRERIPYYIKNELPLLLQR